jgi:hypothetical protein
VCESYRYGAGQFAYVCFFDRYSRVIDIVVPTSHSGVNDTAVSCATESDFLIKNSVLNYSRRSWLPCSVNDTAVICKLTPMGNQLCRLSSRIRNHIRKGFNLCIRDPGEVVWWKQTGSKILCQGPIKGIVNCKSRTLVYSRTCCRAAG